VRYPQQDSDACSESFVKIHEEICPSGLGCNRGAGSFQGHKLGESFAQFAAIEHPQTQIPPGVPYTGTIHCFDTQSLGDQCKGPRDEFDNAHFTFIDDKLASIETVGAGGIIGDSHQNWNWNLYLSGLTKQLCAPVQNSQSGPGKS
jgi:hypothetical protein